MKRWGKTASLEAFFKYRIYCILSAIGGVCLFNSKLFSQEINAYRTISSGNFSDITIWEVFDGSTWQSATAKPMQINDIYIDQTHTLTLIQNEQAKSVFINAESGANKKLNLNGFNLDVYGTLQGFEGQAPGTPSRAWNSQNWIGNSISSTLTFRGPSRTIIPLNAWSGQSDRSRYSVIFDPGPGVELIVEEPFKSLGFTIRSGTVIQKLNTNVTPANCATFSFNNETTVYGPGPFGNFTIEPGARLISNCNENILFRSASISAALLDLQPDGKIILEGDAPIIEAASIQMNGKLIFRDGDSPKTYLSKSYADAANPNTVNNLELQGEQDLTLPAQLFILGDIEKTGTGNFLAGNSHLYFTMSGDQEIIGFSLETQDLTLDKPSGTLISNDKLLIHRNLHFLNGSLDLKGSDLQINSSLSGGLNYIGGTWKNLNNFTYFGIPSVLNANNATFPYEDTQNGGNRKVQLLGNSSGGTLNITFTEFEGADFNAGFYDSDGTLILYRLFSFFQFSGLNPSSNPTELRISAHQLIVDDVDDLRIVGTGYPAPGSHLTGIDPTELWARRSLSFDELTGVNFTIGSFRTASILPLRWLELRAERKNDSSVLIWKISDGKGDRKFEIYRSEDGFSKWKKIGEVKGIEETESIREYEFRDENPLIFSASYYQIRQIDSSGNFFWSQITHLPKRVKKNKEIPLIYPNPYSSGSIHLWTPKHLFEQETRTQILDITGNVFYEQKLNTEELCEKLEQLKNGVYLIRFYNSSENYIQRWIKK